MSFAALNRRQFNQILAGAIVNPQAFHFEEKDIAHMPTAQLGEIANAAKHINDKNYWLNWAVVCWMRGEDVPSSMEKHLRDRTHSSYLLEVYDLLKQSPAWPLLMQEKTPESFAAISDALRQEAYIDHIAYTKRHQALAALLQRFNEDDVRPEHFNPQVVQTTLIPAGAEGKERIRELLLDSIKQVESASDYCNVTIDQFTNYVDHFRAGTLRLWADRDFTHGEGMADLKYVQGIEERAGPHYKPAQITPGEERRRKHHNAYQQLSSEIQRSRISRHAIAGIPQLHGYVISVSTSYECGEGRQADICELIHTLDPRASVIPHRTTDPSLHDLSGRISLTIHPSNHLLEKMLHRHLRISENLNRSVGSP